MRRRIRVCVAVLTVLLLAVNVGVLFNENAAAGSTKTLDWGSMWNLTKADYGGTWGDASGLAVRDGGYDVNAGTAYTYTNSDQGSATQNSYLRTVFNTASGFTGTVWCELKGQYWADASASFDLFGIGDAYVYFYLWVRTPTTEYVAQVIIADVIRWAGASPAYLSIGPANFDITWSFTAVPGETYYVDGFIKGHASSVTDSWSHGNLLLTNIIVYCQVPPGFGGCVLEGTDIMLADGTTAPVESLKKGDSIMGYETSTMNPVVETVLASKKSVVSQIEVINDGLLYLTPTDQPIYVKNDAYTGWITNPCDLQVGWYILDPANNAWVEITSIHYDFGKFTVYELGATSPDNYVANGILLDRKPIRR